MCGQRRNQKRCRAADRSMIPLRRHHHHRGCGTRSLHFPAMGLMLAAASLRLAASTAGTAVQLLILVCDGVSRRQVTRK